MSNLSELDGKIIPVLLKVSVSGTNKPNFYTEAEAHLELIPVDADEDHPLADGLEGSLELVCPISKVRRRLQEITYVADEAIPLYQEREDDKFVKVLDEIDERSGTKSNPLLKEVLSVLDGVFVDHNYKKR